MIRTAQPRRKLSRPQPSATALSSSRLRAVHVQQVWQWVEDIAWSAPLPVSVSSGDLFHFNIACDGRIPAQSVSLREVRFGQVCPVCVGDIRVTSTGHVGVGVSSQWVSWAMSVAELVCHRDDVGLRWFESQLWSLLTVLPDVGAATLRVRDAAMSLVSSAYDDAAMCLVSGMAPWRSASVVCPLDPQRPRMRRAVDAEIPMRTFRMSEVLRGVSSGFLFPVGSVSEQSLMGTLCYRFVAAIPKVLVDDLRNLCWDGLTVYGNIADLRSAEVLAGIAAREHPDDFDALLSAAVWL